MLRNDSRLKIVDIFSSNGVSLFFFPEKIYMYVTLGYTEKTYSLNNLISYRQMSPLTLQLRV